MSLAPFATSSEVCASNPSIKDIVERQVAPHRPATRDQSQAPTFIPIRLRLQTSFSSTALKLTRILCLQFVAKQPAVLALRLAIWVLTSLSRSVPQVPGVTLPGCSNSHACTVSKRPFFSCPER